MSDYSKAVIPDTYRVLGLQLQPSVCIGHFILMHRFGCAFADSEVQQLSPTETIEHFLLAVSICSRSYEDNLDFFSGYRWKESFLHRWFGIGQPVKVQDRDYFYRWNRRWGKAVRKEIRKKDFDLLYRINLFRDYLKKGIESPPFKYEKDEGKSGGGHWTQSILLTLQRELKYTESQAINCPLPKAIFDIYKIYESAGIGTFFNEKEEEQIGDSNAPAQVFGDEEAKRLMALHNIKL